MYSHRQFFVEWRLPCSCTAHLQSRLCEPLLFYSILPASLSCVCMALFGVPL